MLALKVLLPVKEEEGTNDIDSVNNLQSHLEIDQPLILAQIRHRSTPLPTKLSLDELWQLKQRFAGFDEEILIHLAKLEPVDKLLKDFNSHLGELLDSLIDLQQKLQSITSQFGAAQQTTDRLNPIILDLLFAPQVLRLIAEEPINEEWMENIRIIQEKEEMIESIEDGPNGHYKSHKAYSELRQLVEVASAKAVERIRDYIIGQIKLLRSPKLSSQQIQLQLLATKEAYHFLAVKHSELARQFLVAYLWTMRWYYHTRFAKYLYCLQKVQIKHADALILLGAEVQLTLFFGKNLWFLAAPAQNEAPAQHVPLASEYLLLIEKRQEVLLDGPDTVAIPSQIAETTPFSYWLEFVYEQWSLALVNNVIAEYLFMVEFFYKGQEKFTTIDGQQWYDIMFGPVFAIGREFVQWLATHNPSLLSKNANSTAGRMSLGMGGGLCDAIGILLIIRVIQKALSTLNGTYHIPIMDDYHNSVTLQLWPYFTKIIDQNCELMKRAISNLASVASRGAPLPVTQQMAQLTAALLRTSSTTDIKAEPLYTVVQRLVNEYESLLTKLATQAFSLKRQTEREVFLYNNYFLVALILSNEAGDSDQSKEFVTHFNLLAEAYHK